MYSQLRYVWDSTVWKDNQIEADMRQVSRNGILHLLIFLSPPQRLLVSQPIGISSYTPQTVNWDCVLHVIQVPHVGFKQDPLQHDSGKRWALDSKPCCLRVLQDTVRIPATAKD